MDYPVICLNNLKIVERKKIKFIHLKYSFCCLLSSLDLCHPHPPTPPVLRPSYTAGLVCGFSNSNCRTSKLFNFFIYSLRGSILLLLCANLLLMVVVRTEMSGKEMAALWYLAVIYILVSDSFYSLIKCYPFFVVTHFRWLLFGV
jgi:hypothetical protein